MGADVSLAKFQIHSNVKQTTSRNAQCETYCIQFQQPESVGRSKALLPVESTPIPAM